MLSWTSLCRESSRKWGGGPKDTCIFQVTLQRGSTNLYSPIQITKCFNNTAKFLPECNYSMIFNLKKRKKEKKSITWNASWLLLTSPSSVHKLPSQIKTNYLTHTFTFSSGQKAKSSTQTSLRNAYVSIRNSLGSNPPNPLLMDRQNRCLSRTEICSYSKGTSYEQPRIERKILKINVLGEMKDVKARLHSHFNRLKRRTTGSWFPALLKPLLFSLHAEQNIPCFQNWTHGTKLV